MQEAIDEAFSKLEQARAIEARKSQRRADTASGDLPMFNGAAAHEDASSNGCFAL